MGCGAWRQPTLAEEFCGDVSVLVDCDGCHVERTVAGWLSAVGRIAYLRAFGRSFGDREGQSEAECAGAHSACLAELGLAEDMVVVADATVVGFLGRGRQLIAPFAVTVGLPAIGDVGGGLFLQTGHLVDQFIALEKVYLAPFA